MSEFSNLLNRYIHQKGYSIRSLAKRAGIPVATLTKLCSGARSPRNQRDRVDRISDVLMLTPSQREALTDMLEKEIVGAENYASRASVKALIEGMTCTVQPARQAAIKTVLPDLVMAEKRTDVYSLMRAFLENAAQGSTLDIYLPPQDPVLMEALCRVIRGGTARVRHILALSASDGKMGAVDPHNLETLRCIQPLLLDLSGRRDAYQAYYYYERTATLSASALQFPNVMVSEQGVLFCAADYNHAMYTGNPAIQRYFQRLFRTQLNGCRPLIRLCLGLREQIERYVSVMQAGDPKQPLLTLEWQPCLMWAVSEQEIQYFLPQGVPFRNEYINQYIPYLRKIQQWEKAILFFTRDGLEYFAQTGSLQEIPDDILDGPLPVSMRAELLRRMLEGTRQGRIVPHIVREEKLHIGRDAQLISYGSDTILLASLNHLAGNQVSFIEELSANWCALDFLENLENTDWILSTEETCEIIRDVMERCLREQAEEFCEEEEACNV